MSAAQDTLREIPHGFEGAVAGLTLPDVIQMNALNRFSGCITVHFGSNDGVIFFRDGDIIHAEQGELTGEPAFYEILQWPGGKFNLQPKITTTSLTIRESWKFLLMEACRLLDENKDRARALPPAIEKKGTTTTGGTGMSLTVTQKVAAISGVNHVVLVGKDGLPVGDASYEGERLAAQAVYTAMLGNELGKIFTTGEMKGAAVHGTQNHLLVFESKNHFLGVGVGCGHQLGAVEAEIRTTFIPKK